MIENFILYYIIYYMSQMKYSKVLIVKVLIVKVLIV